MLSTLKKAIPNIEISVLPYYWKLKELWETLQILYRSDLLILGGGQPLHDQTSVLFTLLVLSKVALVKLLQKRIMCYAIGVGPLKTSIGKVFTKLIINRVELITVRDPQSKGLLKNLGITRPPIYVTADASLNLPPVRLKRVKEIFVQEGIVKDGRLLIAIAPRRWFHYNHSLLPVKYMVKLKLRSIKGESEFKKVEQVIARVADYLVKEWGANIIFIPMRCASGDVDPGQDDDKVSSEIAQLMQYRDNTKVITQDYTPQELKGILGQMDLVIGMRMHSTIMASTMGVPVIGIGYSPKFKPFFEMIGQNAYLIDINQLDRQLLSNKIKSALSKRAKIKKELTKKTKPLQIQALMNTDFVLKLLNRA
jgi:polysaccharide pyruvyl transferase WcaK-like protein